MITVCVLMVFYIAVWQALDIVPSSRKGYRGDLSSQSPEMPTTNSALLPGKGALLDFLKHELVLQLPWSCLVALFVDMICGEFQSSVSFFQERQKTPVHLKPRRKQVSL